ncbi:COX assembly mitochondrial protein-like [Hondaea fermentalgiana]|uniref:COX assembly mitochondrial protein n=1 Tax=Hondaea fermentalgiana TaxID=2315210 RepID=A0A2R5GII3_9STRA|nr:COX assembly mitochondrial protein-like [Hondaea fermentalgiana]|eukprot:GBG28091.1 COX assembly mitochondrial protein-like [Hondaea fermentalgiana]
MAQRLRTIFLKEARERCKDETEAFVECAREHNLMVIFKCRHLNKAMNECVSQYTSTEQWEEYRQMKIDQYLKDGSLQVAPPRNK